MGRSILSVYPLPLSPQLYRYSTLVPFKHFFYPPLPSGQVDKGEISNVFLLHCFFGRPVFLHVESFPTALLHRSQMLVGKTNCSPLFAITIVLNDRIVHPSDACGSGRRRAFRNRKRARRKPREQQPSESRSPTVTIAGRDRSFVLQGRGRLDPVEHGERVVCRPVGTRIEDFCFLPGKSPSTRSR